MGDDCVWQDRCGREELFAAQVLFIHVQEPPSTSLNVALLSP
jgi:hypothetical protein